MHLTYRLALTTLAAAAVMFSPARADPVAYTLDYASVSGAAIRFDGHSHFTFTPAAGSFQITSAGAAYGLLGEMTGTYAIGTVTTAGVFSSAPVTGEGRLIIHDGVGSDLTGTLRWADIVQVGAGDFLNTSGTLNLTAIAYPGSNPLLLALASAPGTATDVLSFQFAPARPLAKLKTAPASASFSGVIEAARIVADGGSIAVMAGAAIAGAALLQRRRGQAGAESGRLTQSGRRRTA